VRSRSIRKPASSRLRAYDGGRRRPAQVNELICFAEAQIHTGRCLGRRQVSEGVGQALMEAIVFDSAGQLVTGSLPDYAMPRRRGFSRSGLGTDRGSGKNQSARRQKSAGEGRRHRRGRPRSSRRRARRAESLGIDHIDMPATPSRVCGPRSDRARSGRLSELFPLPSGERSTAQSAGGCRAVARPKIDRLGAPSPQPSPRWGSWEFAHG